jgi:hypothetical protein
LASDSLAGDTLANETLARVTFWTVFLLPLGYQRVNKNSIGVTTGKNLKKIIITFLKKKGQIFFQIFPNGPPHGIFIHPLVPQRKQEKLAKVSPAKVTLAKMSFWPKCHSGLSVIQPNYDVEF